MERLLKSKLANMNEDDLMDGLFRDHLTGVWNRRAFEVTPDSDFVALVDLDSLKWINDNRGHREGDKMLSRLASHLDSLFPESVFRVSGDEYVVRCNNREELVKKLTADPYFSVGVGHNLVEADKNLRVNKETRIKAGMRARRGEIPVYLRER